MITLDYIVTGTGRCGTLFTANVLTSAGISCAHEAVFTPMGLDFALKVLSGEEEVISSTISRGENLSDYEINYAAESSYMSAPFLSNFDSKIIHVIRNPQKVVSSFLRFGYFREPFPASHGNSAVYEEFIYKNLPQLCDDMPQLDRTCLYWALWNEIIENSGKVNYRQKIERSMDGLYEFIGSKGTYSKPCNVSNDPTPSWNVAQIQNPQIRKKLKEACLRYGYHLI